jgi:antitoxin (DNA-binding transcriptional repressor) of toxin-antitoxin stability system
MPPNDGVRLHEHDRRAPVPPESGQGDPKQSVACLEVRALGRTFHRRQLLPQGQVLQDQFAMSAERQRQRAADHDEHLQHASIVDGVGAKINAAEFWRGSLGHAECSASRGVSPTVCVRHLEQLEWLLELLMTEKVSTIDVRQRIGDMLNRVALRRDEFVIERKGKALAALVPIERLEQMRRFARRQALDFMEEQQAGRLTEREASDLALEAQRFTRKQVRKPRRGKK